MSGGCTYLASAVCNWYSIFVVIISGFVVSGVCMGCSIVNDLSLYDNKSASLFSFKRVFGVISLFGIVSVFSAVSMFGVLSVHVHVFGILSVFVLISVFGV